jgi:peptidoglycan/xylan/chitin deacetylase (PgdA/CDA1 family)
LFQDQPLDGASLPEGTLCLTFDDGPGTSERAGRGPKTRRLAEYLADEGIPATFFVCGKHVAELPHVVERVRALGHLIANHTQTHPNLRAAVEAGEDVARELADTDALIRMDERPLYFRPPYGSWSADVATVLNADENLSAGYVGPVNWDIDGEDWVAWRDARSAEECAQTYVRAVEDVQRGIVLMHDSTADVTQWQGNNATLETVMLLVPELRSRGYGFVGLEDVQGLR